MKTGIIICGFAGFLALSLPGWGQSSSHSGAIEESGLKKFCPSPLIKQVTEIDSKGSIGYFSEGADKGWIDDMCGAKGSFEEGSFSETRPLFQQDGIKKFVEKELPLMFAGKNQQQDLERFYKKSPQEGLKPIEGAVNWYSRLAQSALSRNDQEEFRRLDALRFNAKALVDQLKKEPATSRKTIREAIRVVQRDLANMNDKNLEIMEKELRANPLVSSERSRDTGVLSCLNESYLPQATKAAVISEYYLTVGAADKRVMAMADSIAEIDQMLGLVPFSGESLSMDYPGLEKKKSDVVRNCGAPKKEGNGQTPQFNLKVQSLLDANRNYWISEFVKRNLKSKYGGSVDSSKYSEQDRMDFALAVAIQETAENLHPEIKQSELRKVFFKDPAPSSGGAGQFGAKNVPLEFKESDLPTEAQMAAALKAQLITNKSKINEQAPKIKSIRDCYDGQSGDTCVTQARKDFAQHLEFPPFGPVNFGVDKEIASIRSKPFAESTAGVFGGEGNPFLLKPNMSMRPRNLGSSELAEIKKLQDQKTRNFKVSQLSNWVDCRTKISPIAQQFRDDMFDYWRDRVIDVGVAALTFGGSAAFQAIRGGAAAVNAGRAARLSAGAKSIFATTLGVDLAFAAGPVMGAIEACATEAKSLTLGKKNLDSSEVCPLPSFGDSEVYAESSSCAMSSLVAGLSIALPLVGGRGMWKLATSPKNKLMRAGMSAEEADAVVARIRKNSLPTKPGLSQRQIDMQHAEAFTLAAALKKAGIYKPGAAGADGIEKAIAQFQDLFPGASRWTNGPRLDANKALKVFKEFSDPSTPNAIDGLNEVLGSALKKLKSQHGDQFTKEHARMALREAIDEIDKAKKLGLSEADKIKMIDCPLELMAAGS